MNTHTWRTRQISSFKTSHEPFFHHHSHISNDELCALYFHLFLISDECKKVYAEKVVDGDTQLNFPAFTVY